MTTRLIVRALIAGSILPFAGIGTASAEGVNYAKDVWPILAERCVKCHSEEKHKGDLRMDSPENFQKGGELGVVIVPGKPDESTLYKLITLPKGDDDIMPSKGEPLAPEQIAVLRQWIEQGPNYDGWDPALLASVKVEEEAAPETLLDQLAKAVQPAPEETLAALRTAGPAAMPVAMENSLLQVNYLGVAPETTDEKLAALAPVAAQITWLNLAGTKITDAGLQHVGGLTNLTMLHLEKTEIGDAGLAHLSGLANLEYLNLYGTKVTDAGLGQLSGLANLKKLYLWQTGATLAGVDALKAKIAGLDVNIGVELAAAAAPAAAAPAATEAAKADLSRFFDADGCCAKAHADGKACDHPCCVEAAAKDEVCAKCNAKGAVKAALVAKFTADSCCAKAAAEGKDCDHPCCVEAAAKGEVCAKCNPPAAAPVEAAKADLSRFFDADGCCAKAHADGKACDHPCCVEAAAKNEVCAKCNAKGAAKLALTAKFTADSCCAKAAAEGKDCDHPCCVEAAAKGEVCAKCNPPAEAPAAAEAAKADLSRFFDADGCCAKAHAETKACDHPCCVEAAAKDEVCAKCNAGGAKKLALTEKFAEGGCCAKAHADGKDCDHPCCKEAAAKGEVCTKCNPAEKPAADAAAAAAA